MAALPVLRRFGLAASIAAVSSAVCLIGATGSPVPGAKAVPARSWPMFGGSPARNLENLVEQNIASAWTLNNDGTGKNVLWSVPLGSKAYGGPIVAGGHIYVGTNNQAPREPEVKGDKGVLMCFNEADGKFLWQSVHDKLPSGSVNDWEYEGIASSPYVEGDRLWYVSNQCQLICATTEGLAAGNKGVQDEKYDSKTDADILWRLDMIKTLGVFPHYLSACSPLVIGDTVFVTTGNGRDEGHRKVPAPDAPSFIAVDKNTGAVKWTNNDPGSHIMHGQWSSPAYAEPNGKPMVIFGGGDGWLRAFDPKAGALIWKFDCNPAGTFYTLGPEGTKSDFLASPVIYKNKLYIAVGQDPEHGKGVVGHLWCVDITKEPKNKDKDLSPAVKPPEKKGEKPQSILDPKDPANKDSGLVWHYGGNAPEEDDERVYYFGRSMSTGAVHDGLVYAAEVAGFLHCLDAETGKQYWEHDPRAGTWCSPYYVDGKVYLGNERGVTVFQAGKEKKILAVNRGRGGCRMVWGSPVAVNGVLYLITQNPCRLWAIAER